MSANAIDPFLVVGLAILMLIMLIINIYILVYWQHPEDKSESILARLLIVFGLQICAVSVLMLPVDFANGNGSPECDENSQLSGHTNTYCGGLDMANVWIAFSNMIVFTLVTFIPFATFYYESEGYDLNDMVTKKSRLWPAMWQEAVVIIGFLIIILSLYFTNAGAEIPVMEYTYRFEDIDTVEYTRTEGSSVYTFINQRNFYRHYVSTTNSTSNITTIADSITSENEYMSIPIDFPVYLVGLFNWIGWFFFSIFVGVGLTSTPFDFICAFVWRPKPLAPDELANKELELQERTAETLEVATLLRRDRLDSNDGSRHSKNVMTRRYLLDRMEVNKLTQMIFLLERDIEELRGAKDLRKGYNPLMPYFNLMLGCIFAMISLLWIMQIILSIITEPAVTPFLSLYLLSFNAWFPIFGNLTYALFSLYLLLCTVNGCFKLSVRSLCIKIHPMRVKGTYLNAFLFNLGIIMSCTIPLVNFCTLAFSGYTKDTDAYFLFLFEMNNLKFFRVFFASKCFVWIILLVACVLIPYLVYRPRDVAVSTESFKRNLHDRAGYAPVDTRKT